MDSPRSNDLNDQPVIWQIPSACGGFVVIVILLARRRYANGAYRLSVNSSSEA